MVVEKRGDRICLVKHDTREVIHCWPNTEEGRRKAFGLHEKIKESKKGGDSTTPKNYFAIDYTDEKGSFNKKLIDIRNYE